MHARVKGASCNGIGFSYFVGVYGCLGHWV